MGFRKVLSLTALVAGVYLMGRATAPDLGEVIDYIDCNPQHQEIVINKTMDYREKKQLGYSPKTLVNFSKALLYEFDKKKFSGKATNSREKSEFNRFPQLSEEKNISSRNSRKEALRKFKYMKDYIYDFILSEQEDI